MNNKKLIRKLYNSFVEKLDEEIVQLDSYKELLKKSNKNREQLQEYLGKSNFELLDSYICCQNEMASLLAEESFVNGFVTAYKLLFDSVS